MKFILTLYDRNGVELRDGDIVKISNRGNFDFYSEVKYLEKEQAIAPFHTFSFSSVVKVDSVPNNATLSKEERYKIWYLGNSEKDEQVFNKYLMSWRECEHNIDKAMFRIQKIKNINPQQTLDL